MCLTYRMLRYDLGHFVTWLRFSKRSRVAAHYSVVPWDSALDSFGSIRREAGRGAIPKRQASRPTIRTRPDARGSVDRVSAAGYDGSVGESLTRGLN